MKQIWDEHVIIGRETERAGGRSVTLHVVGHYDAALDLLVMDAEPCYGEHGGFSRSAERICESCLESQENALRSMVLFADQNIDEARKQLAVYNTRSAGQTVNK